MSAASLHLFIFNYLVAVGEEHQQRRKQNWMVRKYYLLTDSNLSKVAYARAESGGLLPHELTADLRTTTVPFKFVLMKPVKIKGLHSGVPDLSGLKYIWVDYQPNNFAWPIFSNELKNIINKFLTGKENVVWMETIIVGPMETKTYYVPRFEKMMDVLDEEKTVFVAGTRHIIKPVFSLAKVAALHFFHKPQEVCWEITSSLYISEALKKSIEAANLVGIDFESKTIL